MTTGPPQLPPGYIYAVKPPTNQKAILGLCLGLLWLRGLGSTAAVVLGLRAHNEIRAAEGRESGYWVAIAAMSIGLAGALPILGFVGLFVFSLILQAFGYGSS